MPGVKAGPGDIVSASTAGKTKSRKKKLSDLDFCEKDAYNRHCWKEVGVDSGFIIYLCTQCNKCRRKKVVLVEGSE